MRLPAALWDASAKAVTELDVATSATALTATALRAVLEAIAMQAALDQHYQHYPQARSDLSELAQPPRSTATRSPGWLRQATAEVSGDHPAATPDEVPL